jgi:molybdenum cofactor cytidylyltransferase
MSELGAVILAAGASSRMGRPKMLLPWAGTSILGHLIAQSRQWAAQVAVVTAAGDAGLASELDRLGFPPSERITNPAPHQGMFSSIQCAARWSGWRPEVKHWAILLGDQPHLRHSTLEQLKRFAAQHPEAVCQPARHGRPRHPVILPNIAWAALAGARDETLKQFLSSASLERVCCEIDDPGLDLDLDHPHDYEQALRVYFPAPPPRPQGEQQEDREQ